MNPVIKQIYATADQKLLGSAISPAEGELIQAVIRANNANDTIEIGCAFGLSSLFICDALSHRRSPHHVIIDPYQMGHFGGRGVSGLRRAGFDFFELIERPSELALPELLGRGAAFDFALIDGFHTLDHTLVDVFFLNRMLRVGGIIAIDDNDMPGVHAVVRHLSTYPCYQFVGATKGAGLRRRALNMTKRITGTLIKPFTHLMGDALSHEIFNNSIVEPETIATLDYGTMVAFKKIDEDRRGSEWHRYF